MRRPIVGHCVLCSVYVPCTVVGCNWFVQCMRVCKYCMLVYIYHYVHVQFCVGVGCVVVSVGWYLLFCMLFVNLRV